MFLEETAFENGEKGLRLIRVTLRETKRGLERVPARGSGVREDSRNRNETERGALAALRNLAREVAGFLIGNGEFLLVPQKLEGCDVFPRGMAVRGLLGDRD